MELSRRCGGPRFDRLKEFADCGGSALGTIGMWRVKIFTGDGREISPARACGSMEPISQMRGPHFDRRKVAFGARRSAVDAGGTCLATAPLLDGRRVRRPQPRAEGLQPVRNGEGRLAHVLRLNIKPLEVRGRQALRAVDGAT